MSNEQVTHKLSYGRARTPFPPPPPPSTYTHSPKHSPKYPPIPTHTDTHTDTHTQNDVFIYLFTDSPKAEAYVERVSVHGLLGIYLQNYNIILGPFHRNCRLSIATKNRSFFYRSVKFPIRIVKKHDTGFLSATRNKFSDGI